MGVSSKLLTKDKIEARTGMKVTIAINPERAVLTPNTEQETLTTRNEVKLTPSF
jgi:hypothetical protein